MRPEQHPHDTAVGHKGSSVRGHTTSLSCGVCEILTDSVGYLHR
jgi:hypothetical protein